MIDKMLQKKGGRSRAVVRTTQTETQVLNLTMFIAPSGDRGPLPKLPPCKKSKLEALLC